MSALQNVPGTWFGLPDFGLTELFNTSTGGNTSNPTFNNPAVYQATVGANQPTAAQQQSTTFFGGNPTPVLSGGSQGTPQVQGVQTGGGDSRLTELLKIGDQLNGPQKEELARLQSQVNNGQDQMRNNINSGWDSYTNQLNDMLNVGLPGQQQAQQGIAQTSLDQGIADLGAQRSSSEQAVTKQQTTNLKDLADNVRNLFQSGNVYLGSRGAGDSSASNQYSYAIGKMGTKARGDIMTQVSDRMNQIGDIYNQETTRLKSDYQTRINGIADWFNNAQNQVRSQIGQAGLGRSQDLQGLSQQIYNQALSAMQTLQGEMSNKKSALETWAMNNSKTVQELATKMQSLQQVPQFSGLSAGMPSVDSSGNYTLPATGYGSTTEKDKGLFG
jgi:hypothetical protein